MLENPNSQLNYNVKGDLKRECLKINWIYSENNIKRRNKMGNQQPDKSIIHRTPKREKGFIYMYTSPSGKKYIGQTIQTLSERARRGKGYRKTGVFYKAIQKYGFENFDVEILEEADSSLLNEKEIEWISFLNTRVPNGYNISEGGGSNTKTVHQYDAETGEYLRTFDSLTEASRHLKLTTIQHISNCYRGRQKTAHGYIWTAQKYDRVDPQTIIDNTKRPVYAYRLDGTFYKGFDSITAAAKAVEGNRGDIKKCIEGKLRFSKGYIWEDQKVDVVEPVKTGRNGSKPVKQIDPNTNEVIAIFESQSAAARAIGVSSSSGIGKVCQGKQKTSAGYRWEFL